MEVFHYFLIWGHGLPYFEDILDVIRAEPGVSVRKIFFRKVHSMRRLVKAVYSMDYAPFSHLRSKTRYLLGTPNEVAFIFVGITDPETEIFGEGRFRHLEALPIRRLKDTVRSKWNPLTEDVRGEEHVIHATDNEPQTAHMLGMLGYSAGLDMLRGSSQIIAAPEYLGPIERFQVRDVQLNQLDCHVLQGDRYLFHHIRIALDSSPHYLGLTEDMAIYRRYLERFRGVALTEDYSAGRFKSMQRNMTYLQAPFDGHYVIARKDENGYLIQDGLHRASVLKAAGKGTIRVVVL